MSKAILITFISFLSLAAQAGFGGDWIGWGTWKFKGEGDGVNCNPMTMKWVESKTQVGVTGGDFDCEMVGMELGETMWNLKDGKLFDDTNVEVGTYDGTTFEATMPSPNENTTIYIKAKRAANHLDYQEIWYNKYEKVYVIEGRLFTSGD
ncbi:MAG: hypothetical protein H7256_07860 [Bdellovibrio sp.]|nr:hypothetical protein [Bdellovibrio sp.]